MNVDSYFAIGKTHHVCQDYAFAEVRDGIPLILVSDGCSSSEDTDFGSRVLTRVVRKHFWEEENIDLFSCTVKASHLCSSLGVSPYSLDATLLMAFLSEEEIQVTVVGDGVVMTRKRETQEVEIHNIVFKDGAPGYLSYLLNEQRLNHYYNCGWGARTVWHRKQDGELLSIFDRHLFKGFSFKFTFSPEEYDLILLGTDGLTSFQKRGGTTFEKVLTHEVSSHLTNIQNYTGQFLTRRVRRFLHKWCPDNGWLHNDDVAVAAIHIPSFHESRYLQR